MKEMNIGSPFIFLDVRAPGEAFWKFFLDYAVPVAIDVPNRNDLGFDRNHLLTDSKIKKVF
ncbi:MAG: hypothetical protein DRH06_03390 [Deltaproteobacteria bacterium]|nr:MAG: hypothetical protein DRH07_10630 [Deltaproteobacteria bacterium]RLB77642.1 MAG: hypothetical protein DRH06_03390 [Deltaproteobacteria bacterium]